MGTCAGFKRSLAILRAGDERVRISMGRAKTADRRVLVLEGLLTSRCSFVTRVDTFKGFSNAVAKQQLSQHASRGLPAAKQMTGAQIARD